MTEKIAPQHRTGCYIKMTTPPQTFDFAQSMGGGANRLDFGAIRLLRQAQYEFAHDKW